MQHFKLTQLNPETVTVGEIVAANYNAAGIFRRYGLDFCCGGGITLEKACSERNLYLDDIVNELRGLERAPSSDNENYRAWEADYLIEHIIQTHHRFVRRKTEEISAYAGKVAKVHGGQHPENVEIYQKFMSLSVELMEHLEDEEKTVFPLISRIAQRRKKGENVTDEEIAKLKDELKKMEDDHEGAGGLIAEIRELSHNFTPPQDACATYIILYQNLEGFEMDLHKHVHLENNILFKKAEELIA
ncbi:MAG: iron-sulfur cluster repair di-iron protein [Balneolaceae bacterium]|nr:iron-sulfur cluster repair di-iron protein [Balneolaceae bacterium]